MEIELCGGGLGVAELAKGATASTLGSQLVKHIQDRSATVDVGRVLNSVGYHLVQLCEPHACELDLFKVEQIKKRVVNRLLKNAPMATVHVSLLPKGQTVGEHLTAFVQRFEAAPRASRLVSTGEGLAHHDFHGGNVLVDASEAVWAIDYATAEECAHALTDLGCARYPTTSNWHASHAAPSRTPARLPSSPRGV